MKFVQTRGILNLLKTDLSFYSHDFMPLLGMTKKILTYFTVCRLFMAGVTNKITLEVTNLFESFDKLNIRYMEPIRWKSTLLLLSGFVNKPGKWKCFVRARPFDSAFNKKLDPIIQIRALNSTFWIPSVGLLKCPSKTWAFDAVHSGSAYLLCMVKSHYTAALLMDRIWFYQIRKWLVICAK